MDTQGIDEWTTYGPYGPGTISEILVSQTNSNNVWALSSYIGLYLSQDGGQSWEVMDNLEKMISNLNFNKTPRHLQYIPGDSIAVSGMIDAIYTSEDYGASWQRTSDWISGNEFKYHPFNRDVIYVRTWQQLLKTTNGGQDWIEIFRQDQGTTSFALDPVNPDNIYVFCRNGLYISRDAGMTWAPSNTGLPEERGWVQLFINPNYPSDIYLSVGYDQGLYKSTDAGQSWAYYNFEGKYMRNVSFSPHNSNRMYALAADTMFVTYDNGSSWQPCGNELAGTLPLTLCFAPSDSNVLYYGTIYSGLYKSTDNGNTWKAIPPFSRASVNDLSFSTQNPNELYASTGNLGFAKSEDKGFTWELNNTGLPRASASLIIQHPNSPETLFLSSWSTIFESNDYGETWQDNGATIKRWLAISPHPPFTFYTGDYQSGLFSSSDQGKTWNQVALSGKSTFEPVVFHPNSPDTLYIGVSEDGLYRSIDGGTTWELKNTGLELHTIRDIEISPSSPNTLYLSMYRNGVYRSDDAGESWHYAGLYGLDVYVLTVDPINPDIIYAGTSGWGEANELVYMSLDGGQHWSSLKGKLLNDQIHDIVLDPENPYHVFLATGSHGIWDITLFSHSTDIATQHLVCPTGLIGPYETITPSAIFSNHGESVSDLTVICEINKIKQNDVSTVYKESVTIPNLARLQQSQIAFPEFLANGDGQFEFKFYHTLIQDDQRNNDTLSVHVRTSLFLDKAFDADIAEGDGGRGVAIADFDNDGYADIYHSKNGNNSLFRNNQDGTFGDRAEDEGLVSPGSNSRSAGWFDFDNDGDSDLLLQNQEGLYLFENNNGSFADVSDKAGLGGEHHTTGLGFGDYNNDGFLDFYAVRYDGANYFYSNNGDGTFTNRTGKLRLWETNSNSAAAHFCDYDLDGDQDILLINHTQNHKLFRNNGNDTFTSVEEAMGLTGGGNGHDAVIFDYNNDGRLDFYIINSKPHAWINTLYRNDGDGFTITTEEAGLADEGDGTSAVCGDFDNDGYMDLYVVNWDDGNVLYHNNGDGTFSDITENYDMRIHKSAQGVALFDCDNDGDLDIYAVHEYFRNYFFVNTGTLNNWCQLELKGTVSNADAIGSIVTLYHGGQFTTQLLDGSPGFLSQSSKILHFGLGTSTTVDSVIILWPSGIRQHVTGISANQRNAIVEDKSLVAVNQIAEKIPTEFELFQNYPNPFNPATTIRFGLPKQTLVHLTVVNLLGQEIEDLVNKVMPQGFHEIQLNAASYPSGMYFYRLECPDEQYVQTKKLLLLK